MCWKVNRKCLCDLQNLCWKLHWKTLFFNAVFNTNSAHTFQDIREILLPTIQSKERVSVDTNHAQKLITTLEELSDYFSAGGNGLDQEYMNKQTQGTSKLLHLCEIPTEELIKWYKQCMAPDYKEDEITASDISRLLRLRGQDKEAISFLQGLDSSSTESDMQKVWIIIINRKIYLLWDCSEANEIENSKGIFNFICFTTIPLIILDTWQLLASCRWIDTWSYVWTWSSLYVDYKVTSSDGYSGFIYLSSHYLLFDSWPFGGPDGDAQIAIKLMEIKSIVRVWNVSMGTDRWRNDTKWCWIWWEWKQRTRIVLNSQAYWIEQKWFEISSLKQGKLATLNCK